MKLTYRGVGYDYKPAQVESRESAIAGKYRGAGLKFRTTIARVPVLQPALDLIYRGTHYRLGGTQPNCVKEPVTLMGNNRRAMNPTAPAPLEPIAEQARVLVIQHRQKAVQREMSVLERFEEAIGAPAGAITAYDAHEAVMS
jgi:hypothetical protein